MGAPPTLFKSSLKQSGDVMAQSLSVTAAMLYSLLLARYGASPRGRRASVPLCTWPAFLLIET